MGRASRSRIKKRIKTGNFDKTALKQAEIMQTDRLKISNTRWIARKEAKNTRKIPCKTPNRPKNDHFLNGNLLNEIKSLENAKMHRK